MRTLVVIFGAEVVEAALLLGERGRRRIGRLRLRLRCRRSRRPFCCGLPGSIRSGLTPSLIHHTASADSPPAPTEANGGPLSERIVSGRPNSQTPRRDQFRAPGLAVVPFEQFAVPVAGHQIARPRGALGRAHLSCHPWRAHPSLLCRRLYLWPHPFERYIDDNGNMRSRSRRLPRDQWSVLIRDHHPGFIDWGTFEANRMRINTNTRPKPHRNEDAADVMTDGTPGRAVREGAALRQGLALCGHCGRRLRVNYSGRNVSPGYHCPGRASSKDAANTASTSAVAKSMRRSRRLPDRLGACGYGGRVGCRDGSKPTTTRPWISGAWRSSGVITDSRRLSVDTRPLILTIGWWRAAWSAMGTTAARTPRRRSGNGTASATTTAPSERRRASKPACARRRFAARVDSTDHHGSRPQGTAPHLAGGRDHCRRTGRISRSPGGPLAQRGHHSIRSRPATLQPTDAANR